MQTRSVPTKTNLAEEEEEDDDDDEGDGLLEEMLRFWSD